MTASADLNLLRTKLQSARSVVVLAGAGLSTASGLLTFRGPGGLWRTYSALSLATPEAFKQNTSRVWEFYEYRRQKALQALPTAAHALLARLSLPTLRAPLLPSCTSFTLITQNVDHLSPRALLSLDPAARVEDSIIEMHGSIVRPRCTRCGVVDQERGEREAPICAAFEGVVERVESGEGEEKVERRELPRCTASNCAGLMRPGVVWFGESPARMEECGRVLEQADVLLVVGTSGTVYPAAGFAAQVKRHGGIVAVFNLEGSEGDEEADFAVRGKCEETLPALFDL